MAGAPLGLELFKLGFRQFDNIVVLSDAPPDSTSPTVTIVAPADGLVTNALSVAVSADVVDDSETTVTSTPAGVSPGTLPAGGGTVSGPLPLALEGANTITVSADDGVNPAAATSIDVYRDTASPVITISPAEGTIVSSPIPSFGVTVGDQTQTDVTINGVNAGTATVPGGDVYGVSSIALTGFGSRANRGVRSRTGLRDSGRPGVERRGGPDIRGIDLNINIKLSISSFCKMIETHALSSIKIWPSVINIMSGKVFLHRK